MIKGGGGYQSSKKQTRNSDSAHPDSDSRHTVGESVGSLVRAAACLAKTDTTPPCSSDREPRPGDETELTRSKKKADETRHSGKF